jgi:dTDP-glucose 4,6-dehydratase
VYDEGKRYAEAMACAYERLGLVEIRIARIFNTYGPRMRLADGRVLPAFACAAIRGEPLPVFGDGSQTRSLCYVSDLVDGLTRLLESDARGPVNVGNPEELSVLDLAHEVIEMTGSSSGVVFKPSPQDDPRRRKPDITRARAELRWEPKVGRAEGLTRTIEDFRTRLEAGEG